MQDLHFHFDDFKNSLEKDFKYLKEATLQNIQNFQTSLNLQQMYSSSLCSDINNIYSKLSELQQQIQHHCVHMNQGDTVQIEAPDFDPDIDGISSPSTDEKPNKLPIQGTSSPTLEVTKPADDSFTPAMTIQQLTAQETDWPMLSPCKSHESLHQQHRWKNKDTSEARPNITPKVLKFLIWRKILKRSSLPIWTRTWHTTSHTKPANIYVKNTDPVYMT